MPNNCHNYLFIEGSEADVCDFIDLVKTKNKHFDFNKIIPMPTSADVQWSIDNWGTKWNCDQELSWDITKDNNSTKANIFYLTAWNAPTKLLLTASKIYPNITFQHEYIDDKMKFVGRQKIINGNIIEDLNPDWYSEEGIELRELLMP